MKIFEIYYYFLYKIKLSSLWREKKDLKDFAISKFAKDLLDVIDNLERAVVTSTKEYEGKNNDLFEGTLIYK